MAGAQAADPAHYLDDIKGEMKVQWPANRTINLVFHGHSVPAGYFKTPVVNTFGSYPIQVLKEVKAKYPFAVINAINTAIGGENSVRGEKRFRRDVLIHQPDVIFIDYALNDRGVGLDAARSAWEKMIRLALKKQIKVILLTPSPDQRVDLFDDNTDLARHAQQIRNLAAKYHIGLADSYAAFRQAVRSGSNLADLMAQVNHPDEIGNGIIAGEIMKFFGEVAGDQ
jgi:acyl-CoA thioesterase-1